MGYTSQHSQNLLIATWVLFSLLYCNLLSSLTWELQLAGIGRLLVLDEFFEFPNVNGLLVPDANTLLESLIYYFDEPSPLELEDFSSSILDLESFSEVESFRPRHGIHLYLRSNLLSMNQGQREDSQKFENGGSLVMPMITHVREASTIRPINLEGGAGVRVIAGDFSGISTPPPLEDFVSSTSHSTLICCESGFAKYYVLL